ncbi:MAG: gliding motility lipoprotein GldH [Duncaniella sp.]|nr:gliding motility lipoprotein GldH [Duncaniella sp.]
MKFLAKVIAIAALVLTLLASCGRGRRSYSGWETLPERGWAYGDTVKLNVLNPKLTDNDSTLDGSTLLLGLRHGYDYPYSNIWLEVSFHTDSLHYMRDTVNIRLADIYGRWLGKGFGANYQTEVPLATNTRVDLTREVSVRHIMRVDTLRGLIDIGIEVR